MAGWDPVRVKAHLRLASQRLGQLQDKMESQAHITRIDIATLLQQGNIPLARAKASKLLREDNLSDTLETLEMHVGVILGHLSEFERSEPSSPVVIEAASTIVYAAPQLDYKELQVVRDVLVQRLGPDFVRSVTGNRDEYVSLRVLRALSAPPPSASRLDQYLYNIARANGVNWVPDLPPHEKVNALSQMLDPSTKPVVDVTRLRELCSHGLPEYPSWLRSRIWRLLLGTLPPEKASWDSETKKNRDNYYDLVRRLLEPFASLPPPTSPLASLDASLLDVSTGLARVPPGLLSGIQEDPEAVAICPLDDASPEEIKIACANNLNLRLRVIRGAEAQDAAPPDSTPEIRLDETPEIRLDGGPEDTSGGSSDDQLDANGGVTPGISLSAPDSPSSSRSPGPTTLVPSRAYSAMGAHHKHVSALLRLLYIHSCLNPANRSPHIASLLVPLYSALIEEVEPEDVAHVEADAFWLFEAMVGEFSEMDDEEGEKVWTRKFGERVEWADSELADALRTKGLDPALPHYSYRWLLPLLTHTFPLPYVLMVWDALFSRPMRERDSNPKLDYLLDICTSMLLCAKDTLLRLGRPGRKTSNLWGDETARISDPMGSQELDDGFIEGMAFLQQYPLEAVGGVDTVLQLAYDLALRREAEANAAKAAGPGIGARFRETVWKGFITPVIAVGPQEETESEEYDSEADLQPGANDNAATLGARLANSVWRGISNQSAMEPPPSPEPPLSPLPSPIPEQLPELPPKETPDASHPSRNRSIWGYAEKLKESDAAATLAKVSTNWRVKALDVWSKRASVASAQNGPPPARSAGSASVDLATFRRSSVSPPGDDPKRQSLPGMDRTGVYSPPARPAHFLPVRDSGMFSRRGSTLFSSNGEFSPQSDPGSLISPGSRGSGSFPALDKRSSKSGPRPLLLNSTSLMTSGHSRSPTSSTITPTSSSDRRWEDVRRSKSPASRDSISSASSLSPSDQFARSQLRSATRSEFGEESGSRIVPIRGKPSPMARSQRTTPSSSIASSPRREHRRMPTETSTQQESDDGQSVKGWGRAEQPDSPTTSPPLPATPDASATMNTSVRVRAAEPQRGSVVLTEPTEPMLNKVVSEVKTPRKTAALARLDTGDTSDSSVTQAAPMRTPRTKSKRLPPRLTGLRSRENTKSSTENAMPDLNSLAPSRSDELDNVMTPRATTFESDSAPGASPVSPRPHRRIRKTSGEAHGEVRTRKVSTEGRVRKISTEGRARKVSAEREESKRDSAVEGDDEGYNDLLSAYESEGNAL
ncbi:regulator of Vps4 activity in the MVB pathway-domain-containing protein [Amylocystis lapponica]|nr:regulator of Vps4 activity in the MVB pathway-domain-containing protein [Amylocystis lapponica]